MEPTGVTRKLAVILVADAVGYTRLMREAEEPTLQTLTEYRTIIDGLIGRHDGRVGWWLNGRVLKRTAPPFEQIRLFEAFVPLFRAIESVVRPPFGLSLIAVGTHNSPADVECRVCSGCWPS